MAIMMLAVASKDTEIIIKTNDKDEEDAVKAIIVSINNRFGEYESNQQYQIKQ